MLVPLLTVACGARSTKGSPDQQGAGGHAGTDMGPEWTGGCGGELTFKDPVVEAGVRQAAGMATGPLTAATVAAVRSLYLKGVHTLAGVECLPALSALQAEDGSVSDLAPLAGLSALRSLFVRNNAIVELDPLAALPGLQELRISGNGITSLAPLAALESVEVLEVRANALTELAPLSAVTALRRLYASQNAITELSPLTGLEALHVVDVADNQIASLDGLTLPLFRCDSNLNVAHNPLPAGEVQRFCDAGWFVTWDEDSTCNSPCLK